MSVVTLPSSARARTTGAEVLHSAGKIRRSLLDWRSLGLLGLHHRWRRRRRKRLEEIWVLDQRRNGPIARDDHVIADAGDVKELGREGIGEPDAAMRGGIARDDTGVERGARPGDPVHPRHRRAAINVGMMPALLLDDRERAEEGRMGGHARRDLRSGDEGRAAIDIDLLRAGRDDEEEWLAAAAVGNTGVGRRLLLLRLCRRDGNRDAKGRDAESGQECGCSPSGDARSPCVVIRSLRNALAPRA